MVSRTHAPQIVPLTPDDAALAYRPVSHLDMACVVLLPFTSLVFVHPLLIVIALGGLLLTGFAWWWERHSEHGPMHLRLLTLAAAGHTGVASFAFLWSTYHEWQEVPPGYTRIRFSQQIAQKISMDDTENVVVSPSLERWLGRSVAISGSIWPTRNQTMSTFVLVNLLDSSFGGRAKLDGTILVRLVPGETIEWQQGQWTARGRLALGQFSGPSDTYPYLRVLVLEDAHARPARSPFGLHD